MEKLVYGAQKWHLLLIDKCRTVMFARRAEWLAQRRSKMSTEGSCAQRKQGVGELSCSPSEHTFAQRRKRFKLAPARLRSFATGMLAGDSLEPRLASECWLHFSPKQNEFAADFAMSSPSELICQFTGAVRQELAQRTHSSPQPRLASRQMKCSFSLVPLPILLCLYYQLIHAFPAQ